MRSNTTAPNLFSCFLLVQQVCPASFSLLVLACFEDKEDNCE